MPRPAQDPPEFVGLVADYQAVTREDHLSSLQPSSIGHQLTRHVLSSCHFIAGCIHCRAVHGVADVGAERFIARPLFLHVRCTFAWGAEVADDPQGRFPETQGRARVVALCLPKDAFDCLQLCLCAPEADQTPLVSLVSEDVDRH